MSGADANLFCEQYESVRKFDKVLKGTRKILYSGPSILFLTFPFILTMRNETWKWENGIQFNSVPYLYISFPAKCTSTSDYVCHAYLSRFVTNLRTAQN